MPEPTTTLTLRREGGRDITVSLRYRPDVVWEGLGAWSISDALNEEGKSVLLTQQERNNLYKRAKAGEDETGR